MFRRRFADNRSSAYAREVSAFLAEDLHTDQISRLEDGRWIVCLPRSFDRHAALDQIQLAGYRVFLERLGDHRPRRAQVRFAVLGELDLEVGLNLERTACRVFGLELLYLCERVSRCGGFLDTG